MRSNLDRINPISIAAFASGAVVLVPSAISLAFALVAVGAALL
jgi:hypothetical protein